MKLSDIKGSKQVKVVGKLMVLADSLSGDEAFEAFIAGIKAEQPEKAVLKLGPLLARDDVADSITELVAFAKGLSGAEAEEVDVISEVMELLTSDVELPAFLSGQL